MGCPPKPHIRHPSYEFSIWVQLYRVMNKKVASIYLDKTEGLHLSTAKKTLNFLCHLVKTQDQRDLSYRTRFNLHEQADNPLVCIIFPKNSPFVHVYSTGVPSLKKVAEPKNVEKQSRQI